MPTPILILPGIGNSGPQHWQTLWEQRLPHAQRVNQRDWVRPVCGEWVRVLAAAVTSCPSPPVLVAHSVACLLVAHWASGSATPIKGALLVAIPDPDGSSFPADARGFSPLPVCPLPFPSIVVASSDDPFGSLSHAKACAAAWRSDVVEIGNAGHINAESGLGDWPEGYVLLQRLLA